MSEQQLPPNFDSIINTQMEAIEKPKPIPQGKWHAQVKSFKYLTSKEKNTPGAEVFFRLIRPLETENDELASSLDLSEKEFRTTFWLTKDSMFRAKEFLEVHCGIHGSGRNLGDVFNDVPNCEVGVVIVHNADKKDPSIVYANIDKTFAL